MEKKVLLQMVEQKKFKEIREGLSQDNSIDLAELLSQLDEKDLPIVFRLIEKEKAAESFSYMDNDMRETLIHTFTNQELKYIVDSMFADDVVDLIEEMPANVVAKLLANVDSETRADINHLLQYPDGSVGSVMTTEFVELSPSMTVEQALEKIRTVGIHSETVYTCYVVVKHKLLGIISAKDMLTNPSQTLVSDLMSDSVISINPRDDQEKAAKLFRKYDLIALPVVDNEGCILGIVTVDDAIDVLTEEATEDMQKMAAMSVNTESYLKTTVWQHTKSRIVWLLVLMISAAITGAIITRYENAFAVVPLLVAFIPMLTDTGGNCGSQSSTLVIRGLAVDELHFSDFFKILWKEFRVALLTSAILAFANGIRIYFTYQRNLGLAITVSLSLIATIVMSKIIGGILPVVAGKCKLDPAIMAAPLITTIVDTFAIIIYFQVATWILL